MTYDAEVIRKRNALILRWHETGMGYRTIAVKLVEAGYERIGWERVRQIVKRGR